MSSKVRSISVGALAVLLFASFAVVGVSAWHITVAYSTELYVGTLPVTSPVTAGTTITDTATIGLSNNGPPFGSVIFQVFAGTCSTYSSNSPASPPSGALSVFPGPSSTDTVAVTSAAENSGGSTYSASISTTGLSGNYVVLSYYAGSGSGGYPPSPSTTSPTGAVVAAYSCEPFSVSPTTGVPQFPLGSLGMLAILGLMFPALVLLRTRFGNKLSSL